MGWYGPSPVGAKQGGDPAPGGGRNPASPRPGRAKGASRADRGAEQGGQLGAAPVGGRKGAVAGVCAEVRAGALGQNVNLDGERVDQPGQGTPPRREGRIQPQRVEQLVPAD